MAGFDRGATATACWPKSLVVTFSGPSGSLGMYADMPILMVCTSDQPQGGPSTYSWSGQMTAKSGITAPDMIG